MIIRFRNSIILLLTLFFVETSVVQSQVCFYSSTGLARLKKRGLTYIVMSDTASKAANEFKGIFRKYWTISKIEFIDSIDINKYVAVNNAFFMLEVNPRTGHYTEAHNEGFYIASLFIFDDTEPLFDGAANYERKRTLIGYIYLSAEEYKKGVNVFDNFGEGHFLNWGTGLLKNYIQELMTLFSDSKTQFCTENMRLTESIYGLKTGTLYIPDNIVNNPSEMNDLVSDYKYNYKFVPLDTINQMILADKTPFFYIDFAIDNNNEKYVSVVDSHTGEFIYCTNTAYSKRLKAKDLKQIYKAASK